MGKRSQENKILDVFSHHCHVQTIPVYTYCLCCSNIQCQLEESAHKLLIICAIPMRFGRRTHMARDNFKVYYWSRFNLSIVSKLFHFKSAEGEETPPHTPTFFFFLSFLASLFLAGDVWLFPNSGSSKVQLVMSLILFILYGCSVWKKERRERERREEMVLRKEIFSAVACIMNEGALCLKLQPSRFTSRFAG